MTASIVLSSGAEGVPMLIAHFPLMSTGTAFPCALPTVAAMAVMIAQRITCAPQLTRTIGIDGIGLFPYLVWGSLPVVSGWVNPKEASGLTPSTSGRIRDGGPAACLTVVSSNRFICARRRFLKRARTPDDSPDKTCKSRPSRELCGAVRARVS